MYGSIVIIVNPKYTAQKCLRYGHIEKSNRDRRTTYYVVKIAPINQMMIE
ncbi:transposase domain protein [Clostridioides difficile CD149]|nr:hypothetical protein [Clostridioides difficile]EQE57097.1 transposase domain protein [Clostridioides difficile CD43]EQE69681.1 transposase domain protein [Clostridioides difficile CD45]EQE88613.1 transposase domain protein [Clostridioides difficile CD69]EQF20955.1 transposase domain protein [Clostridioides difficile CD149]EQF40901.1 transposase domain protein [Clostridioides difficile CD166]EQH90433.1 transposase domain protein [Clostridioides difficile F152]EQL12035.1 transposase domain 